MQMEILDGELRECPRIQQTVAAHFRLLKRIGRSAVEQHFSAPGG